MSNIENQDKERLKSFEKYIQASGATIIAINPETEIQSVQHQPQILKPEWVPRAYLDLDKK